MTSPGLPEHEQQAWDAIVADLRADADLGPTFAEGPPPAEPTAPVAPVAPVSPRAAADAPRHGAADAAQPRPDADPLDEDVDEGYVPPHPPPLPRPDDAIGRFSWAAVLGGPTLVFLVTLLGWDRWLANLGIVLAVGGFVSLVWRMKDRDDDDDDDGAVV